MAEQSRSLVVTTRENAYVAACVARVGRVEFRNLDCQIVFGGVDMIGAFVVVDENGHVARHLSAVEVAHGEHALTDSVVPFRRPPFHSCRPFFSPVLGRHIQRIVTGVDASGSEQRERAERIVGRRNGGICSSVASVFELMVEPEYPFAGVGAENYFRPFDCATVFERSAFRTIGRQNDSAVGPVFQIGR